ncbi:MAG: Ig-like domain-containing protein [Desulfobacteria bacterium]
MNKINKGNVVTKPGRLMKMGLPVVTLLVTMLFAAMLPGTALAVGGDFANTDFAAAAPFTYNHATGGGAYNDRTVGDYNDVTEQLEGAQFTCGDIVTYLVQIELEATTVDPVQTAEFDFSFLANSTGQAGVAHSEVVGVSINYGSVENGDDGAENNPGEGSFGLDSGIVDDRQDITGGDTGTGGSAATLVSQGLTGPLFQSGSELRATVRIDDLEPGEKIVLRIDTRLACDPGSAPTGNLQGQMNAGRVVLPEPVDTINTGEQTIPFLRVGDIAGAGEPLVEIEKTVTTAAGACGVDDVEQMEVIEGNTVKYCYTVINPGTKELFDVQLVDDNGTPGNTSDDFNVSLTGLADLDGEADLGDLAPVATATGYALVTLNSAGTVVNTADASGNNGLTGGNYQVLTDSDTATVVVNEGQDNPPVANDDEATTPEDTPVDIDAVANDSDVDGNLDPSTATVLSGPSNGTVTNNNDGTFTYTPDENFFGTDSFEYQVCDTDELCDTATVTIDVTPVNDPPVALDDSASTEEDTPVEIDAVANDSDVDGNLDPSTAEVVSGPSNGTVTNNGDGTFIYTPDENFFGTDSFEYQVCDTDGLCDTATVTVAVATGNDPPVAVDDYASTDEDTAVDINATTNDSDVDGNLDPSTAEVVNGPSNGQVVNNGDGTFTYTPDENFFGTDSFEYQVCDTDGLCDTAMVTINVIQVKHPPVANDDSATTPEDTPVDIDVADNDSDVDGNLDPSTATVIGDPSHGTMVNNNGTFTYTPDPNFNGTDSFVYQVCDTTNLCDTATVNIVVTPVNDPPVALNDSESTDEDTAVDINATTNDSDVDNNLDPSTAEVVNGPSNGTVVNNNDGTFTYTPAENFNGTDSFVYQVCDTGGLCDTATVNVNVNPVNDPPVALNDSASTDEDTAVTINATANDSDVDGNLDPSTATVVSGPSNGTVVNNNDGTFTYTPDENFNGIDSFEYQVCDTDGLCDTAIVTVAVAALNDPPVANNDEVTTPEDAEVIINATANDTDVDNNLDPSTASVVSGPSNGTVVNNNDGTFTYTPAENFNGSDSFVYEVCDLEGLCDTAEVIVNVTPVNDPPVAVDDAYITMQDTTLTVDAPGVLVNDSDVDGDTIVVDSFDAFSQFGGSVSANPDGSFSYTPASGFAGFDTFTYTISDGNGGTDTAMVTITVDARNNRSISLDLQDFTLDETSLSGYFLITNQSDGYDVQIVDMQIEVQYRLPGAGWTYVVVNEGSCSFNPSANFLVVDQQSVDFSGCELAELIPDGATVRVTANVKIFGRIKGKGKADGWFLSRLSK